MGSRVELRRTQIIWLRARSRGLRSDGKCDSVAWILPKDDTDTIVFTAIVKPVGADPYGAGDLCDGKRWAEMTPEEHQRLPGDFETQVSQGPIPFHSEEHLTGCDLGIAYLRRNLKAGLKDIAEGRDPPLAFGPPEIFIATPASVTMMANPDYLEQTQSESAIGAPPALSAPNSQAAGKWKLTLNSPMGAQTVELTLESEKGVLTGVMEGSDGAVPITDAKESGAKVQWKAAVKKPFPVTLAFDVTIEGDTLSGKFKPGMFPAATVVGVRA